MGLKRSSLISNLLNRVDGTYLAVRNVKGNGCEFYFESETNNGLAANKQILDKLEKDELESLCFGNGILPKQNLQVQNFNLDKFQPKVKKEKVAIIVNRDYSDRTSDLANKLDLEMNNDSFAKTSKSKRK